MSQVLEYEENEDKMNSRMRADQHKCLPHLAWINPTLLFIEYFLVLGQYLENEDELWKKFSISL